LVYIGTGLAVSVGTIYYFLKMAGEEVAERLPIGQREVDKLQVLHVGPIPEFDEKTWTFEVYGSFCSSKLFP